MEYARIEDHPSLGSVSREVPESQKYKIKVLLMEKVNHLDKGLSFGEAALLSDAPRNATCFVMSDRAITAILTKNDFNRVMADRLRQAEELKVAEIQKFDLFKDVAKMRLKNFCLLFFHKRTQEPYRLERN